MPMWDGTRISYFSRGQLMLFQNIGATQVLVLWNCLLF